MARSSDASFPMSLVRDKTFQLRQIRRVLFLSVFFIVQSTLVLAAFYHAFLGNVVQGNAPLFFASEDIGSLSDAIPAMSTVLTKWMLVMLVINSIVTLSIAVYILRRLGNPILAIKRALNEIGDGNLNVRLRVNDSDEFGELVEALNRALERVNSKIQDARELSRVIETLENQPLPDNQVIREALTGCNEALRFFDPDTAASNESIENKRTG